MPPSLDPIRTKRLVLRPLKASDAQDLLELLCMPQVMRYTTRAPFQTLDQVRTYIAERTAGPRIYNFAVTLCPPSEPQDTNDASATAKVIGLLGSPSFPDVGYLFHPSFHGKGYATEALLAFVPALFAQMPYGAAAYAFTQASVEPGHTASGASTEQVLETGEEGFDFVIAQCDVENMASRRLLERCGWTLGEIRESAYTSPILGIRADVTYRIARPGLCLEEIMGKDHEDEGPPVPDLM